MSEKILSALQSQNDQLFWAAIAVVAISAIISALISFFFNRVLGGLFERSLEKRADDLRSELAKDVERTKSEMAVSQEIFRTNLKKVDRTIELRLEARLKAVEMISELQSHIVLLGYDLQADDGDRGAGVEVAPENTREHLRWEKIFTQLREVSAYFVSQKEPFMARYEDNWMHVGRACQRMLDDMNKARARQGGTGRYTLNTETVNNSCDALKKKIFEDAQNIEIEAVASPAIV